MASQKSLDNFVISNTEVKKVKCVFVDVNNNNHDDDDDEYAYNGAHDDIGTR